MADDDAQLAVLAREGSQRAFTVLVGRHQDRVFRFIMRMTGSRDEAMDLTQDTFMKSGQALPTWQPQALFRSWLFMSASNGGLDALRRRSTVRFEPLDDDPAFADDGSGPQEQLPDSVMMATGSSLAAAACRDDGELSSQIAKGLRYLFATLQQHSLRTNC